MMKFKYFILLILFHQLFYSQNNLTDSLKTYSYNDLSQKFYSYNNSNEIRNAKIISKYYLKKAKSEKNQEQISEGYVMMHFNENLPNALKYLDSLQIITKNSDKDYYPARIYLLRGNLYSKFYNVKTALGNYVLTLDHAREKGNKRQIAFAEISIAYLNNYIGKYRDAANTLRHYLYNTDYLDKKDYDNIRVNLVDTYIEINKIDSARILIEEGLLFNSENGNTNQYYGYLLESGFYNLKIKKYHIAIENLIRCKKYFFTTNNIKNQSYTLLFLGQSYVGLKETEKAIETFIQLDSHIQQSKHLFPELREVYPYLINYYKEKNDKEKQLYFIEKFLKIDQILDSQFRYISRELPRRYDKPRLLKEKENIINELKNRKRFFYFSVLVLLLILLIFIFLYRKSKKAEKQHRKIAQDLIYFVNENKIKRETISINETFSDNFQEQGTIEDKTTKTISQDVAQNILKELENFEAKEQFINKGITLGSLAKKIRTNSKYLSEIINTYKGKNFTGYINDLRIDYAIKRLAEDRKFRSYKISSIAEELGYNTEQAFTLAFKKRTGTPLSIYLKEVERIVDSTDYKSKNTLK
ncbi:helix-turn-helix domain-containing protein [Chryseobacterium antibioticum]|uniref:Helix-turn-helix domain-containing protein n=1 Tax=Chryseobacterium pyrolae TaxID=2987481 RepID=A0ABT2IFI1_9FLAO|nr:helix-turn-helix domain-containing protein [Chryseobacterium pyrolae]MCT2407389.1 helix-turn-helix domain-containing protein [Chryseobacterium pyrolae]